MRVLVFLSLSSLVSSRYWRQDGRPSDTGDGFLAPQSRVRFHRGQFTMYPDVMADELPPPSTGQTNCIPRDSEEGIRRLKQQGLGSEQNSTKVPEVAEGFDAPTDLPANYTDIEPLIGKPIHYKLCDY